ncbi:MAG TPA: tetratricopeptide repeat protein [Candidatus Eisenbacteria bacterium]|jgi:tetratricopeptide (TPR) repeat protein
MLPVAGSSLLLAFLAAAPAAPRPAALRDVLAGVPADSLVAPLRRFENEHGHGSEGGEAAFLLGQLHYARGEYRQACDAFARAAARLEPGRKPAARYWAGLSWLALKQPDQARAALEEVAQSSPPLRAAALLGAALALELSDRPERALQAYEGVLASAPGEAGPAALGRMMALAERLERPDVVRRARQRLLRDYPGSIEAARVALPESPPPAAPGADGTLTVQIGAFVDPERAKSLVEAAQRAGFPGAQVIVQGEGEARMHLVNLGVFGTRPEAERAGERAVATLGVTYRVIRFP